jgi:hypothetical protein
MIGSRHSQARIVFPKIAGVRSIEVAIQHQCWPVPLAAHDGDDVGPSFLHLMEMRLYTCFLHVTVEKAGALQLFSLRARNVHELLHQLDSFVCLEGSD